MPKNDTVTIAVPLDAERVAGQLYETWCSDRHWKDAQGRVRENWLRVGEFVCRLARREVDMGAFVEQAPARWLERAAAFTEPATAEYFWRTMLQIACETAGLEVTKFPEEEQSA